jgi:pSer/pThr/pTyr-binding forkhead associated (FHA) protein
MEARLIVTEGKYQGCEIPLPETIFLIGRDRQCHLRVHCELVSKLHCAIAAWAGKVRVRDLKSRNGTLLNGEAINGEVTAVDGDRLQIGSLIFGFQIKTQGFDAFGSPIDKEDVKWLLESPADSGVIQSGGKTADLRNHVKAQPTVEADQVVLDDATIGAVATAQQRRNGAAISAGKNLHDYFQQQKLRAAAESAKRAAP